MEQKARFRVIYLEEAYDFLKSLPEKTQDKVLYNIGKSMYHIDSELFKKLENTDGNSAHYIMELLTDYFLFGIRKMRHLLLQLME